MYFLLSILLGSIPSIATISLVQIYAGNSGP
nr:MAG TPA: Protein of unknown function (DUF3789) [Caudoviricetes sp.]